MASANIDEAAPAGAATTKKTYRSVPPLSDAQMISALSAQVTSLTATVSTLSATVTRQNELIQTLLMKNAVQKSQGKVDETTASTPVTKKPRKAGPKSALSKAQSSDTPAPASAASSSGSPGTFASPGLPPPAYSSPRPASTPAVAVPTVPPTSSTALPEGLRASVPKPTLPPSSTTNHKRPQPPLPGPAPWFIPSLHSNSSSITSRRTSSPLAESGQPSGSSAVPGPQGKSAAAQRQAEATTPAPTRASATPAAHTPTSAPAPSSAAQAGPSRLGNAAVGSSASSNAGPSTALPVHPAKDSAAPTIAATTNGSGPAQKSGRSATAGSGRTTAPPSFLSLPLPPIPAPPPLLSTTTLSNRISSSTSNAALSGPGGSPAPPSASAPRPPTSTIPSSAPPFTSSAAPRSSATHNRSKSAAVIPSGAGAPVPPPAAGPSVASACDWLASQLVARAGRSAVSSPETVSSAKAPGSSTGIPLPPTSAVPAPAAMIPSATPPTSTRSATPITVAANVRPLSPSPSQAASAPAVRSPASPTHAGPIPLLPSPASQRPFTAVGSSNQTASSLPSPPLTLHQALSNPLSQLAAPPALAEPSVVADSDLGVSTPGDEPSDGQPFFPHYGKNWLPCLLSAWWYADPENGIPIPLREWPHEARWKSRDKWKKTEWIARGWHILKGHTLAEHPEDQMEKLDLAELNEDVEAWKARWGDKQNTALAVIRQAIRDDPAYASWAPVKFGETKKRKSEAEAEAAAAAAERREREAVAGREYTFIEYEPVKRMKGEEGAGEVVLDSTMCLDDFTGQSLTSK